MSAEWLVGDRVRAEGLATQHPPTRVVDDVCCLGDVAVVAAAGVCALAQHPHLGRLNHHALLASRASTAGGHHAMARQKHLAGAKSHGVHSRHEMLG